MLNKKLQALFVLAFISQTLLVLGANNPPKITNLVCKPLVAVIAWEAVEGAADKSYSIEYSTSYASEPNKWTDWTEVHQTQADKLSTSVTMSPGAKYRFRILSISDNGVSQPSDVCTTEADRPSKDPQNVKLLKVAPLEFTLKWTPVEPADHNGPGFHYIVTWRPRDGSSLGWRMKIRNWRQDTYTVKCDTFKQFDFEVRSANDVGPSLFPIVLQHAFPGADRPSQAPTNFAIQSDTDAIYQDNVTVTAQWEPLPETALKGHLEGYVIQYWSAADPENTIEHLVDTGLKEATIRGLKYDSVYFAQIRVRNNKHRGPSTKIVEFRTPVGVPAVVASFQGRPMGSSAFLLNWTKPAQPNGPIVGYNIYYELEGGSAHERTPQVNNPNVTEAILGNLKQNSTYRVHIAAVSAVGEGKDFHIVLNTTGAAEPDKPSFKWKPTKKNATHIQIDWIPKMDGKPGSSFRVTYRLHEDEGNWTNTTAIHNSNSTIIKTLSDEKAYDFAVYSIDGDFEVRSGVQTVKTAGYTEVMSSSTMWICIGVLAVVALAFGVCVFIAIRRKRSS